MFTEHGCFHVELRGNVLFLKIEGAWNLETSLAYKKAIAETIKPIIGQPWGAITQMNDWELCTPDSEPVLVDIVKDCVAKGLVKEAVVNNKGIIKLELFEKYRNVEVVSCVDTLFKRHVYQNEDKALEWLGSAGFSAKHIAK